MRDRPLVALNAIFIAINFIGIWHRLGDGAAGGGFSPTSNRTWKDIFAEAGMVGNRSFEG